METILVFLMNAVLLWWGCCNRSVNHGKKPHHRSAASDDTGGTTAHVNSVTRTTGAAGEDAQSPVLLSKSHSVPRISSEKLVEATQPETMKMILQQHKEEQDSFATHIPKTRVARRSTEIKAKPPVHCDRDDYKTIPAHMLPSSTDDL
uniref:Secreted protein n=1 Tax=Elaeophora elaphi TaxID=1147741 RepID=A0A0R3S0N2_9BILA